MRTDVLMHAEALPAIQRPLGGRKVQHEFVELAAQQVLGQVQEQVSPGWCWYWQ